MTAITVLGIDCGGTHTDAALLELNLKSHKARLLFSAKTLTRHDNLALSISELLNLLKQDKPAAAALQNLVRITVGATLEVNALIEDKADKVGLALSAGPGINPEHFTIGSHYCIVPGGLDHRGEEVGRLKLDKLKKEASHWAVNGVKAVACVGKFSPRNPEHEIWMGKAVNEVSDLPITLGHSLSGRLDFPRRIVTAYYNAAVQRIHAKFLDSLEQAFTDAGFKTQYRLLKADGGAIPFSLSRKQAVQSILSGPAASVMGAMAAWPGAQQGCSLLLDIGGTTTDIAIFYDGSPILERNGMCLLGRNTLIRSLASVSIGIGGDSLLQGKMEEEPVLKVGPQREGPAMAFGGKKATLLDALNTLDAEHTSERGDLAASRKGMEKLTLDMGLSVEQTLFVAELCVQEALNKIRKNVFALVDKINSRPIYTLAALKALPQIKLEKACVVGGPAHCLRERLEKSLAMPVEVGPHAQVANAIGAALVKPTASLEIYVDTGKSQLSAPALDIKERISQRFTLKEAEERALRLLKEHLEKEGITDAEVEVIEADLFATLDDRGYGARDMRVTAQAKPGLVASLDE